MLAHFRKVQTDSVRVYWDCTCICPELTSHFILLSAYTFAFGVVELDKETLVKMKVHSRFVCLFSPTSVSSCCISTAAVPLFLGAFRLCQKHHPLIVMILTLFLSSLKVNEFQFPLPNIYLIFFLSFVCYNSCIVLE